jgi:AcrR family transcriptional regulator
VLYWFGSKDELLAEALTFEEQRFYEEVTARLRDLDRPSDRLKLLIDRSLDGNDWKLWLELWSRAARDDRTAAARRRLDERWREAIAEIIRDGVDAGEFVAADPEQAAIALAALMDGLAVQLTLEDPTVTGGRARKTAIGFASRVLEPEEMAA